MVLKDETILIGRLSPLNPSVGKRKMTVSISEFKASWQTLSWSQNWLFMPLTPAS